MKSWKIFKKLRNIGTSGKPRKSRKICGISKNLRKSRTSWNILEISENLRNLRKSVKSRKMWENLWNLGIFGKSQTNLENLRHLRKCQEISENLRTEISENRGKSRKSRETSAILKNLKTSKQISRKIFENIGISENLGRF